MPSRPKSRSRRHRRRPDPQARALGQHIRRLREAAAFSFDAFVEETGLGRGYVSELERGLVVPTIHALAKIATALEVTVADLVLGDSPREQLFAATRGIPEARLRELLAKVQALRS